MRMEDLPPETVAALCHELNANPRPSNDGSATLVNLPATHRQSRKQRAILRRLKLALSPAQGQPDNQLAYLWEDYHRRLPQYRETTAGPWRLRHVAIDPDKMMLSYDQLNVRFQRHTPAAATVPVLERTDPEGTFPWMSTTDMELATMSDQIEEARGHVLVAGLGMGIFPLLIASNPRVESITVIEIDPHVIRISQPYLTNRKITIVNQSLEEYAANRTAASHATPYDYCFIDIWATIQESYVAEPAVRSLAAPLMQEHGTVAVWCQSFNDRKRNTAARLAAEPNSTSLDFTEIPCYQCARTPRADVAGLCLDCADDLWSDTSECNGVLPQMATYAAMTKSILEMAQRMLDSLSETERQWLDQQRQSRLVGP